MRVFYCIFFTLVFGLTAIGQKNKLPSQEDQDYARNLRQTYPDDNLVIRNTTITYTFGFDEKTQKVTVVEQNKSRYTCVVPSHETTFVKFYNQESEIKSVEVFTKKGKRVPIYLKDNYYNDSEFFYSDARIVYFNLAFPYLGTEFQVNFKKEYKDVKYFTSTFLSNHYPALDRKIRFVVPEWLNINLEEINFEGLNIARSKTYNAKKKAHIYSFIARDIKAEKREDNAPGPSHVYPHILVLTESFNRNGETVNLFKSTQDLYDWYRSLVDLLEDDRDQLKAKVEELTNGLKSDIEKIKAIYYWVQDNIRYIAFEDGLAGFKPQECHKVYENKYGDCKGMANLTKQMLMLAGYDARLTWIGTKRIAYDYSLPTLAADNHMICTVLLDGKKYFLDPTEKFSSFSSYAERIQGKQALIENGEGYILEKVPELGNEENEELIERSVKIDGASLKGMGHHRFKGESKSKLLYSINKVKSDFINEALDYYINEGDKNLKVFDTHISELTKRDQDFSIKYNFEQKNAISSFGKEMYLDLDYYKEMDQFKFNGVRENDYLFPYKTKLVVKTELEIPSQYQIVELPIGFSEAHEDFSFDIQFQEQADKLIYKKEININKAVIKRKDLDLWDECIDKLNEVYQQQLVLRRKDQ